MVSAKRFAIASVNCPSCHAKVDRESKWCESCGFTGQQTIGMFGGNAPPLSRLLDVADVWNEAGKARIDSLVDGMSERFPQIKWSICTVSLPPGTRLEVFGFWLMNAGPMRENETVEDRLWTVLLVIDADTGRASVTPGYRAETWLSDEMWDAALHEVPRLFRDGNPVGAVVQFFETTGLLLEKAWRRSHSQLKQTR